MSADSDALKVVQSLPGLTEAEQQYLLTVCRGEGFYGIGWSHPTPLAIQESGLFGIDPLAGVGSNNWGADQEQGDATPPTFPHIDHDKNGKAYVGHFARYTTPQKSAAKIASILLKPNVRAAVNAGDLRSAVYTQHANGYFELNPEAYLAAVSSNYKTLTDSLKWAPLLLQVPGGDPTPPLSHGSQSSESGDSSSGGLFKPQENANWQSELEETEALLDSTVGPLDGKV